MKKKRDKCLTLSPCAFGFALGITWGLGALILSYISLWCGIGDPIVDLFASVYVGYDDTYLGGLIGFAWGLVDGFIFGFIAAYIYNYVLCCHSCPICCSKK